MKRSPRRWSRARRRRYLMIRNEAPLHVLFYPQSAFWRAISDEINAGNDNARDEAEIAAKKEGR